MKTYKINPALKFIYDGIVRHVDNCTVEVDTRTVIGFEMRKGGKFSYRVKRYSYDKMMELEETEPFMRNGPMIGRP